MTFTDSLYIIIPAKDEAQSLPSLLSDIQKNITKNIVVIDNNSKDDTYNIAKQFTNHVIIEKKIGYGNACLAGISYINNLKSKPSFICFFDGDGQSQVSDIDKIIKILYSSPRIKYCQGSRLLLQSSKNSLTGSALVANKVFSSLLSKIWKQSITDLGPLRCISLKLLNELHMTSKDFAWTIEMNTKLLKLREPVIEVPVQYTIRRFGKSKISGSWRTSLQAAIVMSLVLFKTALFWKVADGSL